MAGCLLCVELGERWRIQIPVIQLRERGNIMRWWLTGECRVQSIRNVRKQREKVKLGMKLGEKRMASLQGSGSCGSWILHRRNSSAPTRGFWGPTLPTAGGSGGHCSDDSALSLLQCQSVTCPISHIPDPAQRKGCSSALKWQENCQKSPLSLGEIGHHFCSAKTSRLQGRKPLAGDQEPGNQPTPPGFQVPLLNKGRLDPQPMFRISSEMNRTRRKVEINSFELRSVFILRQII